MSIVVGLPRDERARTALHVGGVLARSLGDELVVCTVLPPPWPPGLGRVDAEYQEYLERDAEAALAQARELLPAGVTADYLVARARTVSAGLMEVAEQRGAWMIALGSSDASVLGRVAFGSVAERLLHTSPVPVVLAPRGFRCSPDDRVDQVTAAFGGAEGDTELVLTAAGIAARAGARLRVASFAVRARTPLTAGIGSRAEDAVLAEWADAVTRAQRAALERVAELPDPPELAEPAVGRGGDWGDALTDLPWGVNHLLVVGSSPSGPLSRVFIGSRSSKIVRHSPVPVLVVPRQAAQDLADRVDEA